MNLIVRAGAVAAVATLAAPAAQAATTAINGGVTDITVIDSTLGLLVDETDAIGIEGDTQLNGATFSFGISGGSVGPDGALIEHDGVGVSLTVGEVTNTIGDFLIDTAQQTVFGTLNDGADFLPFFVFGDENELPGVELELSDLLADTLEGFFELPTEVQLNGATFGYAVPGPTLVPLPAAGWMLIAALGGLGILRRNRTA